MINIPKENTGLMLRPSYWASVSGGKDSLFMLNLILHNLDRYPLNGVVHFELEIDYPFIHNVIDYMESECKRFGIPFYRIKPRKTWMELYEKNGFPTRKVKWCNWDYKLDAKAQLEDFLQSQNCYLVQYIGFCADEEHRVFDKKNKNKNTKSVFPLIESGIMEDDILEWAKTQPIFNDYYKYNRRCGCMWCPETTLLNHAYLLHYYPKEYEEMIELAKKTEIQRAKELGRERFSVWQSDPKYDSWYRDKTVRNKYLSRLLKVINNEQ